MNAPGIDPMLVQESDMIILKAALAPDGRRFITRYCGGTDLVSEAEELAKTIHDAMRAWPTDLVLLFGHRGYFREHPWPEGLKVMTNVLTEGFE